KWTRHSPAKSRPAGVGYRGLTPSANPSLAYALFLRAGLKGIEEGYELPDEAEDNVWELSEAERRALGIEPLPGSLEQAVRAMEASELVADTLGENVFNHILANKRQEWQDYRAQVAAYERSRVGISGGRDGAPGHGRGAARRVARRGAGARRVHRRPAGGRPARLRPAGRRARGADRGRLADPARGVRRRRRPRPRRGRPRAARRRGEPGGARPRARGGGRRRPAPSQPPRAAGWLGRSRGLAGRPPGRRRRRAPAAQRRRRGPRDDAHAAAGGGRRGP